MSIHYSVARSGMSPYSVRSRDGRFAVANACRSPGSLIVASNHVSYADPSMVGAATRRELNYLAKQELFRVPIVGAWIASVVYEHSRKLVSHSEQTV